MVEIKGGKEIVEKKHLEIGFVGVIAAGKTTLSQKLADRWRIETIEEKYPKNPFLEPFYENPSENSFNSQLWFLTSKIEQLKKIPKNRVKIIDPALTMDYLYARTHHKMKWMNDSEWNLYQTAFYTLASNNMIGSPDMFVIVGADEEDLHKRIIERNRPYELWILDNYPEYLTELSESVKKWGKMREKGVFKLWIHTSGDDMAHNINVLADRVEHNICREFGLKSDYVLPRMPIPNVSAVDIFPGHSESAIFKR